MLRLSFPGFHPRSTVLALNRLSNITKTHAADKRAIMDTFQQAYLWEYFLRYSLFKYFYNKVLGTPTHLSLIEIVTGVILPFTGLNPGTVRLFAHFAMQMRNLAPCNRRLFARQRPGNLGRVEFLFAK